LSLGDTNEVMAIQYNTPNSTKCLKDAWQLILQLRSSSSFPSPDLHRQCHLRDGSHIIANINHPVLSRGQADQADHDFNDASVSRPEVINREKKNSDRSHKLLIEK
jgi:hypothetical protein